MRVLGGEVGLGEEFKGIVQWISSRARGIRIGVDVFSHEC